MKKYGFHKTCCLYPGSNKGQALVEFIFIFLLFISLVFITLQITLIANAKSILNVAAYVSCRGASHFYEGRLSTPEGKILKSIRGDLEPFGNKGYYNIDFYPSPFRAKFGDKITSTITIYYKLMPLPIVRQFFHLSPSKKSIVLKASCTSLREGTHK